MPKVTEAYFENKRKIILDAAYRLCLQKTVSTVTMLDIIHEVGLSKGGIYRFYSDINVLLADMLDRLRAESNFKSKLDEALALSLSNTFQYTVRAVFTFLGEQMEDNLLGIEKIDFELNILAMNAPKRVEEILGNTKICGNKEYLSKKTTELFLQAEQSGKIRFRIPLSELLTFIVSSYSGIQMTCIVHRCYHTVTELPDELFNPVKQMQLLADAVIGFVDEGI